MNYFRTADKEEVYGRGVQEIGVGGQAGPGDAVHQGVREAGKV